MARGSKKNLQGIKINTLTIKNVYTVKICLAQAGCCVVANTMSCTTKETGWRRCGSTSLYNNETPTGANIPAATDLKHNINPRRWLQLHLLFRLLFSWFAQLVFTATKVKQNPEIVWHGLLVLSRSWIFLSFSRLAVLRRCECSSQTSGCQYII